MPGAAVLRGLYELAVNGGAGPHVEHGTALDYVRDRTSPHDIHKDRSKTTSAIAASSKVQEKSIRSPTGFAMRNK